MRVQFELGAKILFQEFTMSINRQWLLTARPDGMIGPQNFTYAETEIPDISDEEVLVKNLMVSFDHLLARYLFY